MHVRSCIRSNNIGTTIVNFISTNKFAHGFFKFFVIKNRYCFVQMVFFFHEDISRYDRYKRNDLYRTRRKAKRFLNFRFLLLLFQYYCLTRRPVYNMITLLFLQYLLALLFVSIDLVFFTFAMYLRLFNLVSFTILIFLTEIFIVDITINYELLCLNIRIVRLLIRIML